MQWRLEAVDRLPVVHLILLTIIMQQLLLLRLQLPV